MLQVHSPVEDRMPFSSSRGRQMNKKTIHPLVDYFLNSRDAQFWFAQGAGWIGISFVSYFSLNLWYNQPEFSYLAHNALQSLLGMLVS